MDILIWWETPDFVTIHTPRKFISSEQKELSRIITQLSSYFFGYSSLILLTPVM